MAEDNRGWFGQFMDRMNPATDPSRTAATTAGNMLAPGLGFAVGRLIDWNRGRRFDNAASEFGAGQQQFSDRMAGDIDSMPLNGELGQFDQPLMPSASEGLQDSGHTITPFALPGAPIDTGWRTGEGGTGLGGGWRSVDGSAAMATLGQMLSDARGTMGQSTIRPMQQEFGTTLTGANGQTRERGSDIRGVDRGPLMGSATAADFIRNNPEQWAQMRRNMRDRG